jgi:hypothetical protein
MAREHWIRSGVARRDIPDLKGASGRTSRNARSIDIQVIRTNLAEFV